MSEIDFSEAPFGRSPSEVEIITPRAVPLGGLRATTVYRTLPHRRRSMVGAWCFLDHFGPDDVSKTGGMTMPRHPHTGLATVSWLFAGRVEHLDSGGNTASVVAGELNLMIAGSGITHQEISNTATSTLHGVQLWYALPNETLHTPNAFAHHVPEPVVGAGAKVKVFIGTLFGSTSPVDTRTPGLLGAEITLEPGASVAVPLHPNFEHAVLAENADVTVDTCIVEHRSLAYIPPSARTVVIAAGDTRTRVILLGGVPLGERIVMWWNFIGRSHDEIVEYRRRYQAELGFEEADPSDVDKPTLFGTFPPGQPLPIPAPPLPHSRLQPRG